MLQIQSTKFTHSILVYVLVLKRIVNVTIRIVATKTTDYSLSISINKQALKSFMGNEVKLESYFYLEYSSVNMPLFS